MRLVLAHHLDRWESRARRLAEKWGAPQSWLQEFQTYLSQPRMTIEEFHVRYTLKRMAAEPLLDHPMTEAEALDFYRTNDYMLWRNLLHRRHSAWRRVLWTMKGATGQFLEFGCGTAPVSTWVSQYRPRWMYTLEDVESPHLRYARWRMRERQTSQPNGEAWYQFHVITALDVLEHLADPLKAARQLVDRLAPRGILHTNFVSNPLRNDLDLATVEQRDETLAFLRVTLDLVWTREGYCVWRRP